MPFVIEAQQYQFRFVKQSLVVCLRIESGLDIGGKYATEGLVVCAFLFCQ